MQNFKKGKHLYSAYSLLKKTLLLKSSIVVMILLPLISFSQTQPLINSTLKGQIIDAVTKLGIPGVSIHITGTTHVVQTDKNGKFDFVTGQKFPYTLEITYVGYEKNRLWPMEAQSW
ncbi:carboxypeptidase-like regulatory domain-containing protein [Pedobacter panaciterrae]